MLVCHGKLRGKVKDERGKVIIRQDRKCRGDRLAGFEEDVRMREFGDVRMPEDLCADVQMCG